MMAGSSMITPAAFVAAGGMIKRFEGFRSIPYRDATGIPTIGFGFCTLADGSLVTMETPAITYAQALTMLTAKLSADYAPGVQQACHGAMLTDDCWTALLDFSWNLGDPCLEKSGIGPLLAKGNLPAAAAKVRAYNRAGGKVLGGLVTRRNAEAAMILGKPLAAQPPVPVKPVEPAPAHKVTVSAPAPQPTADELDDQFNPGL